MHLACCSVPHDFVFAVIQCCLASFVDLQRFPSIFVCGMKSPSSHSDSPFSSYRGTLACPLSGSLLAFAVDIYEVASVCPVSVLSSVFYLPRCYKVRKLPGLSTFTHFLAVINLAVPNRSHTLGDYYPCLIPVNYAVPYKALSS